MTTGRRDAEVVAGLVTLGVLLVAVIIGLVVTQMLAWQAEPGVTLDLVFAITLVEYGAVPMITLLVMIPLLFGRVAGTGAGRRVLAVAQRDGVAGVNAAAALHRISTGVARPGIAGLGLMGAIGSLCLGAGLVALLFVAATAAIACARDPKCL